MAGHSWATAASMRLSFLNESTSMDATGNRTACQQADAEFAAIHAALCSYRRRRNAIVSISRLSGDILSHIFSFLTGEITWNGKVGWVQVTWVCSRWRNVALRCPSLWQKINFNLGNEWADTFLTRRKSLPLYFTQFNCLPAHGRLIPRQCELMLKHMDRTKELQLTDSRSSDKAGMMRDFIQKLTMPAPLLQSFSLSLNVHHPLPSKLFDHIAPQLRHIVFSNVTNFPWTQGIFRNLVTLSLETWGPRPEAYTASFNDLLEFLRLSSSTLESLRLSYNILRLPGRPVHIPSKVSLPSLVELTLNEDLLAGTYLIRHLTIPHSAQVVLGLGHYQQRSHGELEMALGNLFPHIHCGNRKLDLHVEFISEEEGPYERGDFYVQIRRFLPQNVLEAKPAVVLTFDMDRDRQAERELTQDLFAALPPHMYNIRQVVMRTDQYSDSSTMAEVHQEDWAEILGKRRDIRHIYAECEAGAGLCEALGMYQLPPGWHIIGSTIEDMRVFVLPNLSSLILREVDFDELITIDDEDVSVHTMLCRNLQARKASGIPLDRLRLKACISSDWSWLEDLEGVVGAVVGLDYESLSLKEQKKMDEEDGI
ncbi:hypothetical protein BV25DRAFT_374411 [Artomyces pyxidatus]|uniref:Uncharacterized protein n=1 Tax=Artomyces pyxidatus TaxID=48021 RepID=A0ACB8T5F3_9AGAM|nr:hypothetical protein BV25DRAFT_374411 [Artomyces pyxidatus]